MGDRLAGLPPRPAATYPWCVPATAEAGVEYLRGCLTRAGIPLPMHMTAALVEQVSHRVATVEAPRAAAR
jgi:hypothetical protein